MKKSILVSSLAALLALPLSAQTPPSSGNPTGEASPSAARPDQSVSVRLGEKAKAKGGEADKGNDLVAVTPRAKFSRKWDESRAQLRVLVENTETTELKIEGVQTSANLFVTRFPVSIKAGASEEMVLQYVQRAGASGDVDSVRLLTDQGEKVVEVMQDREQAFTLDTRQLTWHVNEAATTKTVTFTTTKANLKPKGLRIFGAAQPKAEIRDGAPGQFFVDITPASTAAPAHFAIMLELDPAVPGAATVIQCAITPAN